jgi:hypothetical protein
MVILSKPKRQLFLMLFKKKPVFMFTGGLMRLVMNEKRKSSKRIYKVATSLIKLAAILLSKRNFFMSCYVRLIDVGSLRAKFLRALTTPQIATKIHYVFVLFRTNIGAQKFKTRRSIKKYIRKRFKIVT